jgi:3-carboxy-cis,cis-muconate cycloisomerase
MQAPEHAQYLHWGATSQDIVDTALVLRLRQAVSILDARLAAVAAQLAELAEAHAALPMAARTWGQVATPTTFGAVAAGWGRPLLRHRARLAELRPRVLTVSLAGASGTLSAMGPRGPEVAARLAEALGLHRPDGPWHGERDGIAELAAWCAAVTGSVARMGEDLILLTRSEIGEIRLGQGGGSSTMPQKENPVLPSLLSALGRVAAAIAPVMTGAIAHREQRDGAAWMAEWLTLPQLVMAAARALDAAGALTGSLAPQPARMAANLDPDGLGLIHAEALSFALAAHMPRPEAQETVKALCREAAAEGRPLCALAAERWPDLVLADAFDAAAQTGTAEADARAFAIAARRAADAGG